MKSLICNKLPASYLNQKRFWLKRLVILFFILFELNLTVFGTQITLGTSADEFGNHMIETSDGGFLIVGYCNGSTTLGNDGLIIKLSNAGKVEWSKVISNAGDDRFYGCMEMNANYFVVGFTTSGVYGGQDALCVRLNDKGAVVWSKLFGGTEDDGFLKLTKLGSGSMGICGYSGGVGQQFAYVYLVKMDVNGNTSWEQKYGSGLYSTQTNTARDITLAPNGNILLAGYTYCFGAGLHDGMLVAIDSASGERIWTKTYGGSQNDGLDNVVNTNDGHHIASGSGRIDGTAFTKFWMLKLSSYGDTLWQRSYYLDAQSNHSGTVDLAEDQGFVAVVNQFDVDKGYSNVMRLDANGEILWNRLFEGSKKVNFSAVITTKGNEHVAMGHTNSFGYGGYDIYLVKLDKHGNFDTCCAKTGLVKTSGKKPSVISQNQNTIVASTSTSLLKSAANYSMQPLLLCNSKPKPTFLYDTFCAGQPYKLPWGLTVYQPAPYKATFETIQGCDSVVNVILTERKMPKIALRDTFLCELEFDTLTLMASNFVDYRWKPNDEIGHKIRIHKTGTYSLTFTNTDGCTYTKNFEVKTDCDPVLLIPNAFTPNGDLLNEQFLPMGISLVEFYMQIFNRWGQKIFETNNPNVGWDGTHLGTSCPQGAYVVVIKAKDIHNKYYNQVGSVMLLR